MLHAIIFGCLLALAGSVVRAEEKVLYFPIFTHVGGFSSVIKAMNPSEEYRARVDICVESLDSGRSGLDVTLEPNQGIGFSAAGEFSPIERRGGWGSVRYRFLEVREADRERIDKLEIMAWTRLELVERNQRNLSVVTNIAAIEAGLEFRVPGILEDESETALAILNPSNDPIQVDVTLFVNNDEGDRIKNQVTVQPERRLSRFLWELLSEGKSEPPKRPRYPVYDGSLRIRSGQPFVVGALCYFHSTNVFTALPVVKIDE